MKRISRLLSIGVLTLILMTSACNLPAQTPSAPLGTIIANGTSQSPMPTALDSVPVTETPLTPVIPITGENVVEMQCQFCVNERTHAIFIFPDFAIFDVETSPDAPVTCLTAEIVNGNRVLICNGTQLTTFNLKICSEASNCLLFPVALQGCPLIPNTGVQAVTGTPMTPVFLSPINTLRPPTRTPGTATPISSQVPTQTGVIPLPTIPTIAPTSTPVITPPSTSTPEPAPSVPAPTETSPPPPTSGPAPTEPPSTSAPTEQPGGKKPTKTPKAFLIDTIHIQPI